MAHIVEATVDDLSSALALGRMTSVELVAAYLNRIAAYDRRGPRLNSTPVLNPRCFEEAKASDRARLEEDQTTRISSLHGIPFTVKDSYKVVGLTVAAGSPAFADLIAQDDSFAVDALRKQGAIVLGKTNMPPMAVGGCQRGLYGRAESPYNPDYLSAAWHSGSSSGSGVAVSANLCSFGLGEETVSSGRSPASNGGLVAYTPSRGLISIRGNWPLFPLRDTVVPHTRSVKDMLHVLNALVTEDVRANGGGDFWKSQSFVSLPSIESFRPAGFDFVSKLYKGGSLQGRRLGVPKMYIGKDIAEVADPIVVRPSILSLFDEARTLLTSLGATCVDVDFPVVSSYEKDRPGSQSMVERGMLPAGWNALEINDFVSAAWEEFLQLNKDPKFSTLAGINPCVIHADPPEAVDTRRTAVAHDGQDQIRYDYIVNRVTRAKEGDVQIPAKPLDFPQLPEVCAGLEQARKDLYEKWLIDEGLDGVVFPANADIAPSNADSNEVSSAIAWRNGVVFSNMNHVMRHLGIPSMTVPMGLMSDTGIPVGLTFAAPAYADKDLLSWASDYEKASAKRLPPDSTPELTSEASESDITPLGSVDIGINLSGTAKLDLKGNAEVKVEAVVSLLDTICTDRHITVEIVIDGIHRSFFSRMLTSAADSFEAKVNISASERRGARVQSSLAVVVATLRFKDGYGVEKKVANGSFVDVPYQYL